MIKSLVKFVQYVDKEILKNIFFKLTVPHHRVAVEFLDTLVTLRLFSNVNKGSLVDQCLYSIHMMLNNFESWQSSDSVMN